MLQVPRPRPPASSPAPDPATLERLACWRERTLRANLALEARSHGDARRLYEEALAVADELLEQAVLGNRDAGRCGLSLLGASCNNIAELARQQNDVETEGIFSYRAVERFISVASSASAPLPLRVRCLLHLKVASDALYRYFEGRGMWDAAASYSERANAAVFEVRRLQAAARQRAPLARGAARPRLPDVHALARQIRIDVIGWSPPEASSPSLGGSDQEDVLRILEDLNHDELAEAPRARTGLADSTASETHDGSR